MEQTDRDAGNVRAMPDAFEALIDSVARRCALANFARHLRATILIGSIGFGLLLVLARSLALFPTTVLPMAAAALAIAAILIGLFLPRRPARSSVARLIDKTARSKDLFLTAASLDGASGAFQPIVMQTAATEAARLRAAEIAPFHWQPGLRDVACALIILGAGILWLPQWDPLRREAGRAQNAQQQERLHALAASTTLRKEQLAAAHNSDGDRVAQAVAALEKTFKTAKPELKEETLLRLAEQQRELGALWQNATNKLPREALNKAAQQFGSADAKLAQEIRDAMEQRDVAQIQKKIGNLRNELRQLAGMPDGAEKRALHERLAQQLSTLAEALSKNGASPELNAALARALQQLDMGRLNGLAKEALEGADASLALSAEELANLSRLLADADALEAALKNLQMARLLAAKGVLDGEACKECTGMGDYCALYAKLLAQQGGIGPGMGPLPGRGAGGKAPEDDSLASAFRPEKTNTALTTGKMLLEWKISEVGEAGPRAEAFRDGIQKVKQGVSEAIVSEQIPPGYHATIQKYFDALPAK